MMPQNVRHPNRVAVNKSDTASLTASIFLMISSLLLTLAVGPVSARENGHPVQYSSFLASQNTMISQNALLTPDEAAQRARQGRDVKVLKVDKVTTPAGPVYRVKILTKKGRVKYVNVDAMSGDIIQK